VVGDKGYSSRVIRALCRCRGIPHTVPHCRNEHRGSFDKAVHWLRRKVEHAIGRAKQVRAPATRYDKRSERYRALWVIAMTIALLGETH
jgi:transposase